MAEIPKPDQQAQPPSEAGPKKPLHPAYAPADQDTQIVIRFVGNTARIAGFGFQGDIDPFQVAAAAWWLQHQADMMMAVQEQEAERKRVLTASKLPPPGWVGPDSLRGGPR